ncbi:MAG: ATP-binding protein [Sporomusaceae bacterium]|nr:ATP-binding protein [Sporomusaceae bacterium]
MKRLLILLVILFAGLMATAALDRLYTRNEYIRHERNLEVLTEKFQGLVMHSLTDLTATGDLKAFLNARRDLPDREAFDNYACEANRYYPTVTYFGFARENGETLYAHFTAGQQGIENDSRPGRLRALATASGPRKMAIAEPFNTQGRLISIAVDPIYRGDVLIGFAEVHFDIGAIFDQAMYNLGIDGEQYYIRIAAPEGRAFWEKGPVPAAEEILVRKASIPVGNAQWDATVGWRGLPDNNYYVRGIIWASGSIVTLLLLVMVNGVWIRQAWLTKQVNEKTTELLLKNKAIIEAKEAQARVEKLSSLGSMAAGISHEINQPLNSIKILSSGILYSLHKGGRFDPDEIRRVVEEISRQADRITSIINQMRSFIRRDNSARVPCNVNEAVKQSLGLVGTQITNHGIEIRQELSSKLPTVQVPPTALEEVLVNLLVNAMQALDKVEQPEKRITIRTWFEEGVIIVVADNGPGISEEILDKVFEPFVTTQAEGENWGLGLPIAHAIITACNGNINVATGKDGTTFKIHIPAVFEA